MEMICIDKSPLWTRPNNHILLKLVVGATYTLRGIGRHGGYLLNEIVNKPVLFPDGLHEPCYLQTRFINLDDPEKTESYAQEMDDKGR